MNVEYKESIWELDTEVALDDLKQLKMNEFCFYPESDYGHGYICLTENGYECWSIPMYGGKECLENTYDDPEDAFNEVGSWT